MPLPYDPTNPANDPGINQGNPNPTGYNNPYFDQQLQGQQNNQGGFQPQPQQPTYPNWNDVFGTPMNSGNYTTQPPYNPDVFGSGGGGGGYPFYDITKLPGYAGTDPQDPGIPIDKYGHEIPNPYSPFNQTSFGGNSFNGQQTNMGPVGGGATQPYGNPATKFGSVSALPAPAGSTQPQQTAAATTNPDSAFPKYDPAYLAQIQAATENPNGAYANRKPGDYGPIGSPDYVLNPQNQADWQKRFYWLAANPTAFTTGYTQPRDLPATQYDYSKPNSVPYTAFLNNAYADTNAKQGFKELSGVLTPDQLKQTQQAYGWQDAVSGFNANPNQVYQMMDQEARANPGIDYEVVRVAQPDGSVAYGLQKREQSQQAQQARGFGLPAPAAHPASSGGGGSRYIAPARSVGSLPAPSGTQWPAANFSINNYQIPAEKNPYNLLTQPGKIGETVSYGGQVYTYNGVTWVPQSATVIPPNGGGGGRPPQYQSR